MVLKVSITLCLLRIVVCSWQLGSQEGCTCCCVLLVDEVYPSVRRIAPLSAWSSCRCVISLLLLSLLGLRCVELSRVGLSVYEVYEVFILCFNESEYRFVYEPNRCDFRTQLGRCGL